MGLRLIFIISIIIIIIMSKRRTRRYRLCIVKKPRHLLLLWIIATHLWLAKDTFALKTSFFIKFLSWHTRDVHFSSRSGFCFSFGGLLPVNINTNNNKKNTLYASWNLWPASMFRDLSPRPVLNTNQVLLFLSIENLLILVYPTLTRGKAYGGKND